MILDADKPLWRDHKCKDQSASETHEMLFRITAANGEIKWIEHTCQSVVDEQGQYLGVRANNRDVTLREEYKSKFDMLQSELIHMERAATMNTLSYSIAHELNQPLASMRSFAQAAKRFVNKGDLDEVKKALDSIVSENKRAASIIEHLRQMVKKDVISFKKLNINAVVKNTLGLLSQEIKNSNVTLKKNLDPEIPFVYGNNIQMQQVFLNLMADFKLSSHALAFSRGLLKVFNIKEKILRHFVKGC